MTRTAVVTDSAAELPPEVAAEHGISVVPLIVSFGSDEFRAGIDLSMDEFYRRLTAPDAPFPKTAACGPGDFTTVFESLLSDGHDEVVCITVGSRLSATHRSAELARDAMPGRPIHVIDSRSASMGEGLLVLLAAEKAQRGDPAEAIVEEVTRRADDSRLYVALDTLEYLKRGGRISGAQAAIGSFLSVKPIITVSDGVVETVDKPRTKSRARQRILELLGERKADRVWVLHSQVDDVDAFRSDVARTIGRSNEDVPVAILGPSVAPHVGPGAVGVAVLYSSD